jgi:hypothetical protein
MNTEYYVLIDNKQSGPFTMEQLESMIAAGTISAATSYWTQGLAEWKPLSALGLGGSPSAPPPMRTTTPPKMRPSGAGNSAAPPKTSGLAIASLILGLLSFILSIFTAIPAVICGHISLGQIKKSAGAVTGRGMAIAGLVLGYLYFVVLAAILFAIGGPAFKAGMAAALEAASLVHAKQIDTACHMYAAAHNGSFPNSLDELVPNYLPNRSMLISPLMPSDPDGYTYTPGLTTNSPPTTVLVEDKYDSSKNVRIVAYVDGSGNVIRGQ